MGPKGIDVVRGHYVSDTTDYLIPFSLAEMPITLTPGRTLKVTCINISGSDISPSSGASITVYVYLLDEKELI